MATAVAEAKARKDKIAKTIIFSAKVGNQGNVRLSFSKPVALPSYLMIENELEQGSLEVEPELAEPSDLSSNSRRRRRMRC